MNPLIKTVKVFPQGNKILFLFQTEMQALRKLAADYMLNHQDDFLPFLTDSKTGQLYTPGKQENNLVTISITLPWNQKPK